jgi:lysosomal alpha-mannosidase
MNEVPIKKDRTGKDVVVDWYMLDNFNTGGKMYTDANGLQMIDKELMHRKEYDYNSNNTISANYYPVTSAIAIRNEMKNSSTYGR